MLTRKDLEMPKVVLFWLPSGTHSLIFLFNPVNVLVSILLLERPTE